KHVPNCSARTVGRIRTAHPEVNSPDGRKRCADGLWRNVSNIGRSKRADESAPTAAQRAAPEPKVKIDKSWGEEDGYVTRACTRPIPSSSPLNENFRDRMNEVRVFRHEGQTDSYCV